MVTGSQTSDPSCPGLQPRPHVVTDAPALTPQGALGCRHGGSCRPCNDRAVISELRPQRHSGAPSPRPLYIAIWVRALPQIGFPAAPHGGRGGRARARAHGRRSRPLSTFRQVLETWFRVF